MLSLKNDNKACVLLSVPKAVLTGSLFESVASFAGPCSHLTGKLNLVEDQQLNLVGERVASGSFCAYGRGERWQVQAGGNDSSGDPYLSLAYNAELRDFAIQQSQQALGCDLKNREIKVNARRCVDSSDYYLSPHEDCPKTICAILVYLWTGRRGTSLYRLTDHGDGAPSDELGLQKRQNNFHGNQEYQRANLDVISMVKPDCFAYFEHIKTIQPAFGTFLLIPNTRFRGAMPDLPQSYHGVSSTTSPGEAHEQRDLLLIDFKLSDPPPPTLRSLLQAKLRRPFRSSS